MKKIILILLVMALLVGCGAPAAEETVSESAETEETVSESVETEETVSESMETEEITVEAEAEIDAEIEETVTEEEVPVETEETTVEEIGTAGEKHTDEAETVPEETEEATVKADENAVPLGSFTAQTVAGETLDESFFSNAELTVINIWATYCGPCKDEMPVLGKLDREMEDVQVLGVVTDVLDQMGDVDEEQVQLAFDLMTAFECDYPSLVLNDDLIELGFASVSAVPATLFVDKNGNIVGEGFYGALDEANWREVIGERLEMTQS